MSSEKKHRAWCVCLQEEREILLKADTEVGKGINPKALLMKKLCKGNWGKFSKFQGGAWQG